MTGYTLEELAAGWEFKFLRSATGRFRNAEFLRLSFGDEARAGWTLVEKFDDSRVRLKRPTTARADDASLGFDPYRIWVGISDQRLALVIVAVALSVFGLIVLISLLAKP
jgi:hypothetical protein